MWVLKRMIDSHEGWDRKMPKPRGGDRHKTEIVQLWLQYAECEWIYKEKLCHLKCNDTCQKVVVPVLLWITMTCMTGNPTLVPAFD